VAFYCTANHVSPDIDSILIEVYIILYTYVFPYMYTKAGM
jgi:hypothetical protein